ncbi:Chaperonin GroEL (HSP60 family) [Halogranum amylolyticum]|uniref:Chaperonin GroEL (HSP60 family) n=2 Tax=Halogranum amylolyticum TaxID=660520 RepID=A0A1H8UYF0_9EURY|nr:Chaperonin GroEL (HSP60 family) [Halogranum amylolyticum]
MRALIRDDMTQRRKRGSNLWVTHEVDRTEGATAQAANIAAAKSLAETVRTTLGPNGMDKMIIGSNGTVIVTNDGASILDRMDVTDPTAKMLVETAQSQNNAVGDGSTTAVTLMGALLEAAEDLLEMGVHPTTIIEGYRKAGEVALDRLQAETIDVDPTDEAELRRIGATAVTGKWDNESARYLSELAVRGLSEIAGGDAVDVRNMTLQSVPGGSLRDSTLLDGLSIDVGSSSTSIEVFAPHLPDTYESATVALLDAELTIEKADAVANTTVSDPSQLRDLQSYEESVRIEAVQKLADLGVDVVFCQKSIDDEIRSRLARAGILAIERTRQDEINKLAHVTDAALERSVDALSPATVGQAPHIERRTVGSTELVIISTAISGAHVSFLLRGGTEHVAEETKRVLKDCIAVIQLALQGQAVVPGGGAIELSLAYHLNSYASQVGTREQLAIEAFADALETVPATLAASAGCDPVDTLIDLRARHHQGEMTVGVDVTNGTLADMRTKDVLEPLAVKQYAIRNALEGATMILRVDDVIAAEQTTNSHGHDHDHDHDHTGLQHTEGYPWAIGH